MKQIALAVMILATLTGCEFNEVTGNVDVGKAAQFATCVTGCYQNVYGSNAVEETAILE